MKNILLQNSSNNFIYDSIFTTSRESEALLNLFQANRLLEVKVEIQSSYFMGIIDTGASSNYIASHLLNEPGWDQFHVKPSSATVTIANQETIAVLGSVVLPIRIHSKELKINFQIVDSLLYDLILGIEFCNEAKVIIDCEKNELTIQGNVMRANQICQAFGTITRTLIPAYSEKLVVVRSTHRFDHDVFISSTPALKERSGIMTASGLLHPRSENVYTELLCNLTPELIELR